MRSATNGPLLGETMFEERVIGSTLEPTAQPPILRAREALVPWSDLEPLLQRLEAASSQHDQATVRRMLMEPSAALSRA